MSTKTIFQDGFDSAAESWGDPNQLEFYFEQIRNGHFRGIENPNISGSNSVRADELENEKKNFVKEKEKILTEEIPNFETQIGKLKNEIGKLEAGNGMENFKPASWFKIFLYSFCLIFLSVFLYYFYVSVIYEATSGTDFKIEGILPDMEQFYEAITSNPALLSVPSIIVAFGIVLHIFIEKEGLLKLIVVPTLVILTLVFDWLIAKAIHDNIQNGLEFLNPDTYERVPWYESSKFFIILFLGFVAYIFWSIILHHLLEEIARLNPLQQSAQKIKLKNKAIKKVEHQINLKKKELGRLDKKINQTNERIQFLRKNIKDVLIEFMRGWRAFYTHEIHERQMENSYKTFQKYLEKFDVQVSRNELNTKK